jgi:hypothetical protein
MRIPADVRAWLENTQGLIQPDEGLRLAELAADVPENEAIVEIGTHTGLSTCWMAAGTKRGNGAHIVCVDPWGEPRPGALDDPWDLGSEGVLARFRSNVAGTTQWTKNEDYGAYITALRTTSEQVSRIWTKPIGLLFVDAIHEYAAVLHDWSLWRGHMAPGGVVAFHDYHESYPGCQVAIDEIAAGGSWTYSEVVGGMWIGRL